MRYGPPFKYAVRPDGRRIAYQVAGDGDLDLGDQDTVVELGLEVRVGLHTGECELLGDDIGGIAVHIAARVLAQTGAGEIWCSRTVKDLVAGSGFAFADRGTRSLKGVPDSWQLYAVEPAG
jgi:class 3 adenylate cyclase